MCETVIRLNVLCHERVLLLNKMKVSKFSEYIEALIISQSFPFPFLVRDFMLNDFKIEDYFLCAIDQNQMHKISNLQIIFVFLFQWK